MAGGNVTSTGCPVPETLPHDPTRLLDGGDLNWQLHNTGWLVCGVCTAVTVVVSGWLIWQHLSYFWHPKEQRHVVRLLFMPIIYAACSFASYYFTRHALYWQLIRDCYEALVIASFFFLLVSYLSNPVPTAEDPHPRPYATRYERAAQLRTSVKDIHLAFLWWMRVCIGQYILVRPLSTLAAVVGQATGYYCAASWSPRFIHIWTSIAITISVTVAMYCVLQLYVPLKEPLKPYKPLMKALCVKAVVFFMFWQESILALFPTFGIIKASEYWTTEDIVVGLSALLACFEMVIFSFCHILAFSYAPYRALAPAQNTPDSLRRSTYQRSRRGAALWTVLNLADLGREIMEEIRFLVRGARLGNELLLERRRDDFEAVTGRSRARIKARTSDADDVEDLLQDTVTDTPAHEPHRDGPDSTLDHLDIPRHQEAQPPTLHGADIGFILLPVVRHAEETEQRCDAEAQPSRFSAFRAPFARLRGRARGEQAEPAAQAAADRRDASACTAQSVNSGGHFPRELLRPTSYTPPSRMPAPSPPPFSRSPRKPRPPTAFPVIAQPETAHFAEADASWKVGSLPPGAAPPALGTGAFRRQG